MTCGRPSARTVVIHHSSAAATSGSAVVHGVAVASGLPKRMSIWVSGLAMGGPTAAAGAIHRYGGPMARRRMATVTAIVALAATLVLGETPAAAAPPPPPQEVGATPGPGHVTLRWRVTGVTPGDRIVMVVTPYVGGVAQPVIEVGSSCCIGGTRVEGLTDGTAYRFTVAVRTDAGTSEPSARTTAARPQRWAPFGSADRFTRRMHRLFAFRAPTAPELTAWRDALDDGTTQPDLVLGLMAGPAWDRSVGTTVRLYDLLLRRTVDVGGLAYWSGQLRSGVPSDRVARALAGSAEHRRGNVHVDDAGFVDGLYVAVPGRRPTAAEVTYWVGELARGVPRWKVAHFVERGPERGEGSVAHTGIISTTWGFGGSIPDINMMWRYLWDITVAHTLTLTELVDGHVGSAAR